jgi:hypothetical protein
VEREGEKEDGKGEGEIDRESEGEGWEQWREISNGCLKIGR